MKQISTIHGFALSAWAWASVASYIITQYFLYYLQYSFKDICQVLSILYCIALIGSILLLNSKKIIVNKDKTF